MATYDLEEQEQLDQLKHFWRQYGNLVTWALIVVLGAFAAWNGWNWWQRDQAAKASGLFDELERAARAGDAARASQVFNDLKDRHRRTAFTEQGALMTAKLQALKGQSADAATTLGWLADNGVDDEYRAVARLRLAGLLIDQKKYDDALKQLDGATATGFAGLVADRRGDVLMAQGKRDEAKAAYQKAWSQLEASAEYRRLVEAKLTALGAPPEADKPAAGGAK